MTPSPFYDKPWESKEAKEAVGKLNQTLGDQMPPRYTIRQTAVDVSDLELVQRDLEELRHLVQSFEGNFNERLARRAEDAIQRVDDIRDRLQRYFPG
jgi:hypothetical protein